jgi:RNA polymerase sigma-70 factor, ECF subfamily
MEDAQIVNRINKGELDIFHFLYKEYYPSLCVYAKRFTKSNELAEEVVQDVFIRLWEQQGHLDIHTSFKAYLFVSVRNNCLNHLKHLQVVNKFNEHYTRLLQDAQELYAVSGESGDSLLIAKELEEKVNQEIELLPEQCRKIFIMSRYDCLKHQEIADKLDVTINTVHRQTSIALERLRLALRNYLTLLLLLFRIFIS